MSVRLSRAEYARRYGPTRGDRIRLGDTDLWAHVDRDLTAPGHEAVWGYGRNLRLDMAQARRPTESELDVVVCGAVILDPYLGVVKADLGIKDGRIVGAGCAGNPAVLGSADLTIGPGTKPIMAHGLVATPGAVDSHVHLITPRLLPLALSAGVTTLVTAGFEEPAWAMRQTLAALEHEAVNVGLQACARSDDAGALEPLLEMGAVGFKIHEDFGAYPELLDAVLAVADSEDVAVSLHTDGLNESCDLDGTLAAIGDRAVHAYHVEGAGGGHVPDLLEMVGHPSVVCSSTTPTIPFGRGALAEHVDMILVVHGGSPHLDDDVRAARERVRAGTMAAEGPLHELGAISILNSDSQGMGRIGETVRRAWQLAHWMKRWRASEAGQGWTAHGGDLASDNERILRYLAKYTAEPAVVHGLAEHVGSLREGRMADVVLWRPTRFGTAPELVLKGGYPAWGPAGEGNATVRGSEPRVYGPYLGALGDAARRLSLTFVNERALGSGIRRRLGTGRRLAAVRGTRTVTRASLLANTTVAPVIVRGDGTVALDGRLLAADPVEEVPLSRRYRLG